MMSADQLVEAYLTQLAEAAASLPPHRREDLVADVTSHIAEARAAGATSESDVRQVLRRLGDPSDIVAAATDGLVLVEQPPRLRIRDFAALILLFVGPFALVIGWLAGVWLLWTSDRWTRAEKLLGTVAWPVGYGVAMAGEMFLQPPLWLSLVLVTLILVAVVVVLAKNARPGRSAITGTASATAAAGTG